MDRRFTVSENETLRLPNDFRLPVECKSYILTKEELSKCENRMVCTYENLKALRACGCSLGSIRNFRKEITYTPPINTPFREIRLDEMNVNGYTHQHETTIVLGSSLMFSGAHYIIEQVGDIAFEELKAAIIALEEHMLGSVQVMRITRMNAWITV
ncbi:hypothetical protein RB195_001664 [Necator americanus]|uniref:Uncharacterized protein n=1 Tax=Necator americanus TaxID=51031 RepID=A0ABR1DFL6_NECAM